MLQVRGAAPAHNGVHLFTLKCMCLCGGSVGGAADFAAGVGRGSCALQFVCMRKTHSVHKCACMCGRLTYKSNTWCECMWVCMHVCVRACVFVPRHWTSATQAPVHSHAHCHAHVGRVLPHLIAGDAHLTSHSCPCSYLCSYAHICVHVLIFVFICSFVFMFSCRLCPSAPSLDVLACCLPLHEASSITCSR